MSLLPFGRNNSRQSRFLVSKDSTTSDVLVVQKQAAQSRSAQNLVHSPLTFSQALTITAGMAGLVGLLSGVLIRFSLSNSSTARFLSPLQTFPELSDWSSETASDVAKADVSSLDDGPEDISSGGWRSPAELDWDADTQNFDTFSSESFTDSQSTTELTIEDSATESVPFVETEGAAPAPSVEMSARNFDAFADRVEGQRQVAPIDPLKALSRGPLLRKPVLEPRAGESAFESGWEDSNDLNSLDESTSQELILNDERYDNIDGESRYLFNDAETGRSAESGNDYERENW